MDLIPKENWAVKLADLRTEDEVDYQMAMRAITIIALLKNSWQSWYDCMAFDVMVDHLLHRIFQEELKAHLRAYYLQVVNDIANANTGRDGYEMVHDLLKTQGCPLCGCSRRCNE